MCHTTVLAKRVLEFESTCCSFETFSKDNFVNSTLPVSFERDTKNRRFLLHGVYARGSKISHKGGKFVTLSLCNFVHSCLGLPNCITEYLAIYIG